MTRIIQLKSVYPMPILLTKLCCVSLESDNGYYLVDFLSNFSINSKLVNLILFYLLTVVKQKTIYEYDRVDVKHYDIVNGSGIMFTALPTCLDYKNCKDCTTHDTKFTVSTYKSHLLLFMIMSVKFKQHLLNLQHAFLYFSVCGVPKQTVVLTEQIVTDKIG